LKKNKAGEPKEKENESEEYANAGAHAAQIGGDGAVEQDSGTVAPNESRADHDEVDDDDEGGNSKSRSIERYASITE